MGGIVTLTINPAVDISTEADRIEPTSKLRCDSPRYDAGGGGINVARVVHRLDGTCRALYPAGGNLGDLLRHLLDKEGVASIAVPVAIETRISFSALDRASRQQYRFVLPGLALAESEWQACLDELAALRPAPAWVVASGSLPPGVPTDFFARVARVAMTLGARLVLDTSGPALAAALGSGVYLMKPNLRELAELTQQALRSEADWREAAAALVRQGKAQAIALTLGHQGGLLATQNACLRAPVLDVEVVSAIGAGDSFLAAMVWRLEAGDSMESAFRWGMAAGTAALITPATELCRKADVERLHRQVQLTPC